MKKNLGLFLAIILVQIAPFISAADTLHPLIYKIDIKKEISNTTRLYLSNGLAEAYALGADAVLIHMNTYGGQVDAATPSLSMSSSTTMRLLLGRSFPSHVHKFICGKVQISGQPPS